MISVKVFESVSGEREGFAMVVPGLQGMPFVGQLRQVESELQSLLEAGDLRGMRPVMKRWMLSDAANQAALLPQDPLCAVSAVQQPPACGVKVALFVWFMDVTCNVRAYGGSVFVESPSGIGHLFSAGMRMTGTSAEDATALMLERLDIRLRSLGGTLKENCMRTWLYVRDIDLDYNGVVHGRNRVFDRIGLNPKTHYIASTGIEGGSDNVSAKVQLDAYSVFGIDGSHVEYISVPGHMNATHEYGVAFERAVSVRFPDRRCLFVSGTASIGPQGQVLHIGDVKAQTRRMLENVDAVLAKARANRADIMYYVVYLRDMADYKDVSDILFDAIPTACRIIVKASVCRPEWLVEMECMAMMPS